MFGRSFELLSGSSRHRVCCCRHLLRGVGMHLKVHPKKSLASVPGHPFCLFILTWLGLQHQSLLKRFRHLCVLFHVSVWATFLLVVACRSESECCQTEGLKKASHGTQTVKECGRKATILRATSYDGDHTCSSTGDSFRMLMPQNE